MKNQLLQSRCIAAVLALAFLFTGALPLTALAGTTGNLAGVVTDAKGAPLADVKVTAASPSQTATTTSDSRGFYTIQGLTPDTYSVSFQKSGYQAMSVPGIAVFQDETERLNQQMQTELKTIAEAHATGASNLVNPNQGSDVYTVSSQQINAATNPVGAFSTIYNFLAVTPGVTSTIGSQPRIRGGQVTDLGYEFEGIPIQDDIVGFFTSNLSNTGLQNVEVYTGGLSGAGAVNGTGYFNSVLKTGTYPGFANFGAMITSPEQNQFANFEFGGATPDRRYSYYIAFTGANNVNQYGYGQNTFPTLAFGYDAAAKVQEENWVGNFHYRPDNKDDIQVVATNDNSNWDFDYLLARNPGQPDPVSLLACPGAVADPNNSPTYASGGTAPNGQPCPIGLYYGVLGSGQGNVWHHLGGLGKIQWNHNINDHSFFTLKVDENFNQYIFDQPLADPNIPSIENPGQPYNWIGCSNYPLTPGTPVPQPPGDPYDMCAYFDGVQSFWGNRRSNIWQEGLDYTNALSDNVTLKAGVSNQLNFNTFDYYDYDVFTFTTGANGTVNSTPIWPGIDETADFPTSEQIAYFDPQIRIKKLMLNPGVTYAQRHYGFPADTGYIGDTNTLNGQPVTAANIYSGGYTAKAWDPTINGTYTFDPNNVLTFSYGETTSFIASAYVYTSSLAMNTGYDASSNPRDPFVPGASFAPQQNHAAELLWEHNFGNGMTLRVGPFHNSSNNYYASYKPFEGFFLGTGSPTPCNGTNFQSCIPCSVGTAGCSAFFAKNPILTNDNATEETGVEFGLNRINTRPRGTSFWLSATYDNYWDTSRDLSGAYINVPLPANIIAQGIKVRASSNPLWNGTFLLDYHNDRFHLDPLLSYQGDTFFNNGVNHKNSAGLYYIYQNEMIAHGWWLANLMTYYELGAKRNFTIGVNVQNIFNNETPITPCIADATGCAPFDGPQSGVTYTPHTWVYPTNFSQTPRTFYIFAGVKM